MVTVVAASVLELTVNSVLANMITHANIVKICSSQKKMYSSPHISMMTMRRLISSEDVQSIHQMTVSCSPDKASYMLSSSNSYHKSLCGVIFKKNFYWSIVVL